MIEKYKADSERIGRQLIDMAAALKKENGVCLIFLHITKKMIINMRR